MLRCIIVSAVAVAKRLSAVVSDEEYRRVEMLVKAGAAKSIAQLVREAVAEYVDRLNAGKLRDLRTVPLEQALREVKDYLKNHSGIVWPDKMAEELGLDYRIEIRFKSFFLWFCAVFG